MLSTAERGSAGSEHVRRRIVLRAVISRGARTDAKKATDWSATREGAARLSLPPNGNVATSDVANCSGD
jgi:hypothetical protein